MTGLKQFFNHVLPLGQVGGLGPDVEFLHHLFIQPLLVERLGDGIDMIGVNHLDDIFFFNVAEQGNLLLHVLGEFTVTAAEQDIGLDTDLAQLHDGVLGRLGLKLTGGANVWNQGHMDEKGVAGPTVMTELADGLQKGERLDVPDRAADLDYCHVCSHGIFHDLGLDLVGDMGNDLHRSAQVVSPTFFLDNGEIDLTGGEIALLGKSSAGVTLVVPEVKVGFGAVIGYEYLAVLKRRHGAGVHVDVGVQLLHSYPQPPRLQQCAQ